MKDRVPMKWWVLIFVIIFGFNAYGMFWAKALSAIEVGSLSGFAGQRLYGLIFSFPFLFWPTAKILKWKLSDTADILGVCVPFALLLNRFECLYCGCCKSVPIDALNGYRLPIREIEMILYVIYLIWAVRLIVKNKNQGEMYPVFMIWYGAYRFIAEWFREEYAGSEQLHLPHIWSIISVIAGLSVLFAIIVNNEKIKKYKPTKRRKRQ